MKSLSRRCWTCLVKKLLESIGNPYLHISKSFNKDTLADRRLERLLTMRSSMEPIEPFVMQKTDNDSAKKRNSMAFASVKKPILAVEAYNRCQIILSRLFRLQGYRDVHENLSIRRLKLHHGTLESQKDGTWRSFSKIVLQDAQMSFQIGIRNYRPPKPKWLIYYSRARALGQTKICLLANHRLFTM